jgi:hypothetical protein
MLIGHQGLHGFVSILAYAPMPLRMMGGRKGAHVFDACTNE